MATKIKDAAVVTSKYTVNGQDKSRWKNIGAIYKKDDGSMFLTLDAFFNLAALPREYNSDRVIIGLFDPKKRDDSSGGYNNSSFGDPLSSDDSGVPF